MNVRPFASAPLPLAVSGKKNNPCRPENKNGISSHLSNTFPVCVHVFMGGNVVNSVLGVRREEEGASVACCCILTFHIKISIMGHCKISDTKGGEMLHFYILTLKYLIKDLSRIRHLFFYQLTTHTVKFPFLFQMFSLFQ